MKKQQKWCRSKQFQICFIITVWSFLFPSFPKMFLYHLVWYMNYELNFTFWHFFCFTKFIKSTYHLGLKVSMACKRTTLFRFTPQHIKFMLPKYWFFSPPILAFVDFPDISMQKKVSTYEYECLGTYRARVSRNTKLYCWTCAPGTYRGIYIHISSVMYTTKCMQYAYFGPYIPTPCVCMDGKTAASPCLLAVMYTLLLVYCAERMAWHGRARLGENQRDVPSLSLSYPRTHYASLVLSFATGFFCCCCLVGSLSSHWYISYAVLYSYGSPPLTVGL